MIRRPLLAAFAAPAAALALTGCEARITTHGQETQLAAARATTLDGARAAAGDRRPVHMSVVIFQGITDFPFSRDEATVADCLTGVRNLSQAHGRDGNINSGLCEAPGRPPLRLVCDLDACRLQRGS